MQCPHAGVAIKRMASPLARPSSTGFGHLQQATKSQACRREAGVILRRTNVLRNDARPRPALHVLLAIRQDRYELRREPTRHFPLATEITVHRPRVQTERSGRTFRRPPEPGIYELPEQIFSRCVGQYADGRCDRGPGKDTLLRQGYSRRLTHN